MRQLFEANAFRALVLVAGFAAFISTGAGCDGPPVPHTLEGRTDCLACHSVDGVKPYPENHVDRSVDKCLDCHEAGE